MQSSGSAPYQALVRNRGHRQGASPLGRAFEASAKRGAVAGESVQRIVSPGRVMPMHCRKPDFSFLRKTSAHVRCVGSNTTTTALQATKHNRPVVVRMRHTRIVNDPCRGRCCSHRRDDDPGTHCGQLHCCDKASPTSVTAPTTRCRTRTLRAASTPLCAH